MELTEQIPPELKVIVERELQPDERISWIDMPIPTFFTPKGKMLAIFGIVWIAFTVFWICVSLGFEIPDLSGGSNPFQGFKILFALFGLPFLFIGIGFLSSPILEYRKALKTVYVITDRRAITVQTGWSKTIRSFPPSELLDVYRKEKRDGTGDVIISKDKRDESVKGTFGEDFGFLRIGEPEKAEQMLMELVRQAGLEKNKRPASNATIKESDSPLPGSGASTGIGKVIFILVFSVIVGYFFNTSSLQDYQKAQTLTLNEYIKGFAAHKAELLSHDPLWLEIFVIFFAAGLLFCLYELLGKGFGWALRRTILRRKSKGEP